MRLVHDICWGEGQSQLVANRAEERLTEENLVIVFLPQAELA